MSTSRYWFTTLYNFCSYIKKIILIFLHFSMMFFNIFFSYYITLCFYHLYFSSSFMKTRQLYQSNDISLQLYLCIPSKKVYILNQEYKIIWAIDEDIYVRRSCLIRLLFQEYWFHQIHSACKFQTFMSALPGLYFRLSMF